MHLTPERCPINRLDAGFEEGWVIKQFFNWFLLVTIIPLNTSYLDFIPMCSLRHYFQHVWKLFFGFSPQTVIATY